MYADVIEGSTLIILTILILEHQLFIVYKIGNADANNEPLKNLNSKFQKQSEKKSPLWNTTKNDQHRSKTPPIYCEFFPERKSESYLFEDLLCSHIFQERSGL